MIKFIKSNIIFIINSLILVGLFVGVSNMKKTPDLNQVNNFQTSTSNVPAVASPQAIPQIAPVEPTSNVTVSKPIVHKKVVATRKKLTKKVTITKTRTLTAKNRVRRNTDENDD